MRAGRARDLSAVFVDRDGVVNRKAPEGEYVGTWDAFAFLPGALEAFAVLAGLGVPVVVVTNQRGVALGRYTEADVADVHARMRAAVAEAGGRIDAVYHCPHERGTCDCRKPGTGMFERAAREHGIALADAAMIGDQPTDMEAAARIGALRVHVHAGGPPLPGVDHAAPDLAAAAAWLAGGA